VLSTAVEDLLDNAHSQPVNPAIIPPSFLNIRPKICATLVDQLVKLRHDRHCVTSIARWILSLQVLAVMHPRTKFSARFDAPGEFAAAKLMPVRPLSATI
jgi:hypothetical protein